MSSENPLDIKQQRSGGYVAAALSERGRALDFWSFPERPGEREHLDATSQTPDDNGNVLCWRRRRGCSNPDCRDPRIQAPYKFKASDGELWNCPVCGRDRHCRALVPAPNRGCRHHGGKTPVGWDLPQTKDGEFSKHLRLDPLRGEYERMLQSEKLLSLTDELALLKVRLMEIVGQYGGGASRELLQQMKKNRRVYKAQMRLREPNPVLLRQLDYDLDEMLAQGSKAYQVMDDFSKTLTVVIRTIDARDRHLEKARLMITADRAWVMLAHVEETFRVGAEMIVHDIGEDYVRHQCQRLGVSFHSLSPERVQELVTLYRDDHQEKKREMLAYASARFKDLSKTGVGTRYGSKSPGDVRKPRSAK